MLGPETKHPGLVFRFLAEHVPSYGIVSESGKASNSVSKVVDSQLPPSSAQRVQYVSGLMQFRVGFPPQICWPFLSPPFTPSPGLRYILAGGGVALVSLGQCSGRIFSTPRPQKNSKNLTGAIGQAYIEIYRPLSLRMRNCWVLTSCIDYPLII